MKQEHINEIQAILVLALGIILFASLVSFVPADLPWYTSTPNVPAKNLIRITGAYLAGSLLFLIGLSSYFIVLFLLFWSWNKFTNRDIRFTAAKFISFIVLFWVLSSLYGMTGGAQSTIRFERAGIVGLMTSDFLIRYLGRMGAYIVLTALGTLALILTGEFLVAPIVQRLLNLSKGRLDSIKKEESGKPKAAVAAAALAPKPLLKPKINIGLGQQKDDDEKAVKVNDKNGKAAPAKPLAPEPPKPMPPAKPQIKIAQPTQIVKEDAAAEEEKPVVLGEYTLPSLDLLSDPPKISTSKIESGLMTGAKLLEETLASFGVEARVADIERGPAITRYELEPAAGVKVQKFTTLSNDIALAMRASSVRIVAPIPGKNRVGIEIPNDASASVFLKEVLMTNEFRSAKSKLTLCLGKDISGKAMVADLAEMPHMLIAGTTGSGKTVCVNGIIMSMLMNASPDELKFVMVDPKMVEMAQYNDIPHLLCPTVTDTKKASNVLNWVVSEMENRYKRLSKEGVRNIKAFNERGKNMPYIVVIIDELADLMQVSAKTVESSITRLAQLSRAVGIHLILATQRPSVDVITGVIKANFPARISFKVSSKVDSRTVLDMNGAETLLGKGDMLFMKPGEPKPIRGQSNYVQDNEITRVIDFIKSQRKPAFDETILQQQAKGSSGGNEDQSDELFDEAVKLVIETNQASVSILQRRMRLGYTRAARLIDLMEQHGIVGPYVGSKPRDILVDREQWLLQNMNQGEGQKNES